MITLTTYADFEEFLDLVHELIAEDGLTDEEAFISACHEMPALLELDPASTYVPARVVLFDEAGRPGRYVLD